MVTNVTDFRLRLESKMLLAPKDAKTAAHFLNRIQELEAAPVGAKSWSRYRNFWPPAVISALRSKNLLFFLGAGASAAAELPAWRSLLEQRLGLRKEFLEDEYLKYDNLTLGEIASRILGREQLQSMLRAIYSSSRARPTLLHYALAALELPVYITTNYDTLFEQAWRDVNSRPLETICNSSDEIKYRHAPFKFYKIHGSVDRPQEMLVLTRSDYRQHYRSNSSLFQELKAILAAMPAVFTGFSHTDPEVGRLVDDVIYQYEDDLAHGRGGTSPILFNMQFENNYVTNERFAAKGMVSLNVRTIDDVGIDIDARTGGASEAVAELVDATASKMDDITSVSSELANFMNPIKADLNNAIAEMSAHSGDLVNILKSATPTAKADVEAVLARIDHAKALATQGIYVVSHDGHIVGRRLHGLDVAARDAEMSGRRDNLGERPYFKKSKSFRRSFVSDFFISIFNGNSTFAICVPLVDADGSFLGLLFSACQIGQWRTPIEAALKVQEGLGTYILDNEGLLAIPPNREFDVIASSKMPREAPTARTGYDFTHLRILSKKDRIANKLAENIVPVERDDDVISLDKDLEIYAQVQNIADLGWRCAISRTIKFAS